MLFSILLMTFVAQTKAAIWDQHNIDFDTKSAIYNEIELRKKTIGARSSTLEEDVEQLRKTGTCVDCNLAGQDLREIFKSFENRPEITKIILNGSDLSGAVISGANLSNADMRDTIMNGINAQNTNFKNANASFGIVVEGDFTKANFNNARLMNTAFINTKASSAKCKRANFNSAYLLGSSFKNTNFTNAKFRGANCSKTNFENATLNGVNFTNATFDQGTNFDGAKMRDCILQGVKTIIGLKTLLKNTLLVPAQWLSDKVTARPTY